MSEDRGFIENTWGSIGDAYNEMVLGVPSSPTPDLGTGLPDFGGGVEIGPPEPMTDTQLQGVINDVAEQNFAADIGAPEDGGMDISGPDIGPAADIGMDFTPSDAGLAPAEDYAPQSADISGPEISGPSIDADIGPSEGPDMG